MSTLTVEQAMDLNSISTATLWSEDLLPAFIETLEFIDTNWIELPELEGIKSAEKKLQLEAGYYRDDDNIDGISSAELASYLINEDCFDLLNEIAPEGYYFGSHPGDGADFGFWEVEE